MNFSAQPISIYQFAVFRMLMGTYLAWQCIGWLVGTPENPGAQSWQDHVAAPSINFSPAWFPNSTAWLGSELPGTLLLTLGVLCSVLLVLGLLRRSCCFVLGIVTFSSLTAPHIHANPALPLIGLVLLLCAWVPRGDALAIGKASPPADDWRFPATIYWIAWSLLAVAYTVSGVLNYASAEVSDGTMVAHLVDHHEARTGWTRDLVLSLPTALVENLIWLAIFLQATFALASLRRETRLAAWSVLLAFHVLLFLFLGFADLTVAMILVHLFTFDPEWFPARSPAGEDDQIVFFDGECLLCMGSVQFFMTEDRENVLTFTTLQGEIAKAKLPDEHQEMRSIFYLRDGEFSTRSTAVLHVLDATGGIWRPLSWIGRLIPRPVRDFAYDTIARNRYRWFGHRKDACSLLPPNKRSRIVD